MPRTRKINRNPEGRNFYLIDANFLVNRYLSPRRIANPNERNRVACSRAWWKEIDSQLRRSKAIVYVPDVCIAEAYKTLAKKYYQEEYFRRSVDFKRARDKLSTDMRIPPKTLKAATRRIRFHDISTSRDIIIAMDRFYEIYLTHKLRVSVPDLIILATAKYLIDFYNIPAKQLNIVTLDTPLWKGTKEITDIPTAFNPSDRAELAAKVFE